MFRFNFLPKKGFAVQLKHSDQNFDLELGVAVTKRSVNSERLRFETPTGPKGTPPSGWTQVWQKFRARFNTNNALGNLELGIMIKGS